ncbi:MAG TPA: hypothetical protein VHU23_13195 [Rhizomicrobium sp.]|nr:hypothetical protein [Rhizomicrobium sp.]
MPVKMFGGFELQWSDPPLSAEGYVVTIAGTTASIQRLLESKVGQRGSFPVGPYPSLEEALKYAEGMINNLATF